ncbi:MAG TPA: winged helix-turn-helix domain-containing protein [Ktedonobacterales bacterium]|nr:winged helix-turn-helix domain-containing protein [Ktedonobacterales bacterium]
MGDSSRRSPANLPWQATSARAGDDASAAWSPLPDLPGHVNQRWVRRINRALVLACIQRDGPISRVRIAERTTLSRATVSAIITVLLREGVICEEERLPSTSRGGRRAVPLRAV